MSQTQGNRKRRGRGSQSRSRAAEFQARIDSDIEDRGTFWARSNARLGFQAASGGTGRRPRQAVELACTVCGAPVLVERAPKNRYEVRCGDCRAALGGLLQGDEKAIADEMWRSRRTPRGKARYQGLPEFTEEDRAALAEMRARKELGNGQVGNRRRGGGGGGGGGRGGDRRRRRGGGGGGGEQRNRSRGDNQNNNSNGEGGRRRRRRRRGRGEGGGEGQAPANPPAGGSEG